MKIFYYNSLFISLNIYVCIYVWIVHQLQNAFILWFVLLTELVLLVIFLQKKQKNYIQKWDRKKFRDFDFLFWKINVPQYLTELASFNLQFVLF